jgi:hypothetical protein
MDLLTTLESLGTINHDYKYWLSKENEVRRAFVALLL